MKSKFNDDNEELYCDWCKELINLGEQYIETKEECYGEKIKKNYHVECLPEMEDDE